MASVKIPTGYSLAWSGQYENMLRVERLKFVLPITLLLIFALLYMNTKSAFKATVVMLAVPFSAVGAIWLMYLLGYNFHCRLGGHDRAHGAGCGDRRVHAALPRPLTRRHEEARAHEHPQAT